MRVLIVCPLYPPDIADSAIYVKELARRLSTTHQVTILTYGALPEEIPNVTIVAVNKRQPLTLRLLSFTQKLNTLQSGADVLYVENGPSVELPLLLAAKNIPLLLHIGDPEADAFSATHPFRHFLAKNLRARATVVIPESPLPRPEALPFRTGSQEAHTAYEISWKEHIRILETHIRSL